MSTLIQKIKTSFEERRFRNDKIEVAMSHLSNWLTNPYYSRYVEYIKYMVEQEDFDELFDAFGADLEFGTGGIRNLVGVGPNRINELTIARLAKGHAEWIKTTTSKLSPSIVVAYDVRQYTQGHDTYLKKINPVWGISSRDLAEIASCIYASCGIKVYIFENIAPTPELSFAVRYMQANAGINITASHNPPNYNGAKIYNSNGSQLSYAQSEELEKYIQKVDKTSIQLLSFQTYIRTKQVDFVPHEVEIMYRNAASQINTSTHKEASILYSPLHGVGRVSVYKVLRKAGFDVHMESESSIPSGEFETVPDRYPNPEISQVFERLEPFADERQADIILASDPDADRVGVSVCDSDRKWTHLDGNQVGALLTLYLLGKYRDENILSEDMAIICSMTSTRMISKICQKYSALIFDDVLPGFRNIVQKIDLLTQNSQKPIFGFEDTLGYWTNEYCMEKDACVGSIYLSELASILKYEGKTLIDMLDLLYKNFGYFKTSKSYVEFDQSTDMYIVKQLMQTLRSEDLFGFTGYETIKFVDHMDSELYAHVPHRYLPDILEYHLRPDPDMEMMRVLVRPSGTEPKLTVYFEIIAKQGADLALIREEVDNTFNLLERDVMGKISEMLTIYTK